MATKYDIYRNIEFSSRRVETFIPFLSAKIKFAPIRFIDVDNYYETKVVRNRRFLRHIK